MTEKAIKHTKPAWFVDGATVYSLNDDNERNKFSAHFQGLKRHISQEELEANALLTSQAPKMLEAINLIDGFLDSLPEGWLGKTSGNIGLLNDYFIERNRIMRVIEGESNE